MIRHSTYVTCMFLLFLCLMLSSVAAADGTTTELAASKPVNHVVICWYKEAVDQATIAQAQKAVEAFSQVDGILEVRVGSAIASDRDIVDDSFSLGVYILAQDQAALNHYLVHPMHKEFVKTFVKDKVEKLLVYDF